MTRSREPSSCLSLCTGRGQGRGLFLSSFEHQTTCASEKNPHPNPPPAYRGRGLSAMTLTLILIFVSSAAHAASDLRLWYTRPANPKVWEEALPIGSGRMGAMVFGGIIDDRIQFNEDTLWTGKPHDYV